MREEEEEEDEEIDDDVECCLGRVYGMDDDDELGDKSGLALELELNGEMDESDD